MTQQGAKAYRVHPGTRRIPFFLVLALLWALVACTLWWGPRAEQIRYFLLFFAAFLVPTAACIHVSLASETVIIDEEGVAHRQPMERKTLRWEDICDVSVVDLWTATPQIVLTGKTGRLTIDYSSFADGDELRNELKAHLRSLHVHKRYEITEV